MPTLSALDALGRYAAQKRQRASSSYQPESQFAPPEEQSLAASLATQAGSGIANVGWLLDTPAAWVRSGLGAIGGLEDPWTRRVSGKEIFGIQDNPDSWLDDIGGFAAEVALDPLTYLSFGGSALSKGGQIAKRAGLLDDAVIRGLGGAGKRVSRTRVNLEDLLRSAKDPAAATRAAQAAAKKMRQPLSKVDRQPLGGAVGVGLPFMDPATVLNFPGSEKFLGGLDYLGEAARWSPVGRYASAMFDRRVKGRTSRAGQEAAQKATAAQDASRRGAKRFTAARMKELHDAGLMGTPAMDLRAQLEGAEALDPALGGFDQAVHDRLQAELARSADLGRASQKLDDVIKYVPRDVPFVGNQRGGRVPQSLSTFDEASLPRAEALKGFAGGARQIAQFAQDPDIQQALAAGTPPARLWQLLQTKFPQAFAGQPPGKAEDVAKTLAGMWRHGGPELFQQGLYGNHPLADIERHLINRSAANDAAEAIYDAISDPAIHTTYAAVQANPAGMQGSKSLREFLAEAGLDAGEATPQAGALKHIAQRMGVNFDPALLDNVYIKGDAARDLAAMADVFREPEAVGKLLEGVDSITNYIKASLTGLWPAFHARNATGGILQNVLTGMARGPEYVDAVNLLKGGPVKGLADSPAIQALFPAGTQITDAMAADAVRMLMYEHELLGPYATQVAGHVTGELANQPRTIDDLAQQFPGGLGGTQPFSFATVGRKLMGQRGGAGTSWTDVGGVRGFGGRSQSTFAPMAAGEDIGYFTEGVNRGAPFIKLLRDGWDPTAAAQKVNAAHIDYSSRAFTPFEKQVAQRLFPFWKYSSRMAAFLVDQLAQRPGGAIGQTIRGMNRAREAGTPEEQPFVPDYVANTAAIPWPFETEDPRYITGLGLMFEEPLEWAGAGGAAGMLGEAISRANPLIKGPIELYSGKSFFMRGPEGPRDVKDLYPPLATAGSNVWQALGGEPWQSAAPHQSPIDDYLAPLVMNSPLSRATTSLRTAFDPRKSIPARVANLASGMRVYDVPQKTYDAQLGEATRAELTRLGASTFEKPYYPEDRLARIPPERRQRVEQLLALLEELRRRATQRRVEQQAGQPEFMYP